MNILFSGTYTLLVDCQEDTYKQNQDVSYIKVTNQEYLTKKVGIQLAYMMPKDQKLSTLLTNW